jgi:hypothetical protein
MKFSRKNPPPLGQPFGDWQVTGESFVNSERTTETMTPCKCVLCGESHVIRLSRLVDGSTRRCNRCRLAKGKAHLFNPLGGLARKAVTA